MGCIVLSKMINFLAATLAAFVLSACFSVNEADLGRVASGLGDPVWPIPSGRYTRSTPTGGDGEITVRRFLARGGTRVYLVEDANEYIAFYPRRGDLFIAERYYGGDEQPFSAFSYVFVTDGTEVRNFLNECADLTGAQRARYFNNPEATNCGLSDTRSLVFMLDLSMENDGEVAETYRLAERVGDAN